jgi:Na+/proline symporter
MAAARPRFRYSPAMMTGVAIVAFVLVQLGIGLWASRKVKGETDYLVAGRRLGWRVAGFSLFATWFGAESVMGASAAIAEEGLAGGRADPVGYALVLVALGLFLAAPIRRTEAVTLPHMFALRYGEVVGRVTAVLIIPTSLIWGGAQIRALGQIVAVQSPLGIDTAIVVATACVVAYTMLGGLLGDVITDVVQGAILVVGVLAVAVGLVVRAGGVNGALASITPEQLSFVGEGESLLTRVDTFAVPLIGALIVQETISRVLGCRTPTVARKAALFGGGLYLVFGAVPVLIGLLGAHLGLELGDSEEFVPKVAAAVLHPAMFVVFIGAMIAVILSTVDSAMLAVGAIAAHDVLPMFRKRSGDRARLVAARVAVAIAGVAAGGIALASDSIYDLVLFGDSLGTAGVAVVGVMALFTRYGGRWAAVATLSAAWGASIVFEYACGFEAPFLGSLGVAVVTYALVGAFERGRPLSAAGSSV